MVINMKEKTIIISAITAICIIIITAAVTLFPEKVNSGADKTVTEQPESTSSSTTVIPTVKAPASVDKNSVEILVNAENPLPDGRKIELETLPDGHQADKRAYDSLVKMLDAASALGYNPVICSAYRAHETQVMLFNNKISQYKAQGYSYDEAYKAASGWVAIPGTSEHETGLAFDIVSRENQVLDESQLESELQQWLMENCYDYGFILRYPQDKTEITKINFEPWHYRYVGDNLSREIKEKGICLEEYYGQS